MSKTEFSSTAKNRTNSVSKVRKSNLIKVYVFFCCHFYQENNFCGFLFAFLRDKNLLKPIALRKTKIAYNFGLSECNRVKGGLYLKEFAPTGVDCFR